MGGGNHPHIGLDRLMAADAIEKPSDNTRSKRVCNSAGMSPISSETRCPLGSFKAATALGGGAGKRAALVAKQFRIPAGRAEWRRC